MERTGRAHKKGAMPLASPFCFMGDYRLASLSNQT